MEIYVLNPSNLNIIGVVQTYKSVIWDMFYNGVDEFELTVPINEENINLLQEGRYLVRDKDIDNQKMKNVMVIRKTEIKLGSQNGWWMILSGTSIKAILGQRVICNHVTSIGSGHTVENMIRSEVYDAFVNPIISARKVSNFRLGPSSGLTDEINYQLFGQNILDWTISNCKEYSYGWDIYINEGYYEFIIYKGTDRTWNQSVVTPVTFSPEFDNLLESDYQHFTDNYKNVALVGGEGEGTDQKYVIYGLSTGLDRFETYIDGSNISSNGEIITEEEYESLLYDYGKTQLAGKKEIRSINASIVPNGTYKINEDYFLGDLVQIENGVGIKATSRITELIEAEDNNGSSTVPTFGEMEVM